MSRYANIRQDIRDALIQAAKSVGPEEEDQFQAMWDRHRKFVNRGPSLLPKSREDYREFCREILRDH